MRVSAGISHGADCSALPASSTGNSGRWRSAAARAPRAARASTSAGAAGAREDEPQIAGALGQRHQQLIRLRGDAGRRRCRGTPRAASTPSTPRNMPRRGIGIIITPEAARSRGPRRRRSRRARDAAGVPRARSVGIGDRRLATDRDRSAGARAHRPPIGRAATSSTNTPSALTRHSAWIGP